MRAGSVFTKITTEARIDAPIEIVWRVFNDPADIVRWDASDDWHTVWASNDLQVGGLLKLRIEPRREDGTAFNFAATYTRIEPMRVIGLRSDDGRQVRIEFEQTDAGVIVHQTFDAEPSPSAEEQRQDWQGVLDNFALYVSRITP